MSVDMKAKSRHGQRGSRNNNKNMRTKIDISDVDAFLDDVRHDERSGGPVSAMSNTDLFFVDTMDADKNATRTPLNRKERLANKVLYCEANLNFNAKIPAREANKKPLQKMGSMV